VSTAARNRASALPVAQVEARAYAIPTDRTPESDGTAVWDATTIVVCEVEAGGVVGTGWTYANAATARFLADELAPFVLGEDALATRGLWARMVGHVRNAGRSGLASYAIAAVDVALWDLRARVLDVPLCDLLGRARDRVPAYGSGGFTSYDERTLCAQLERWARDGFAAVKMKVGRDHAADAQRVRAARAAIGEPCALFVDANGGYDVADAIAAARRFSEHDVTWFEQPVDHRDLEGTRRVRDQAPPGMAIASGEYVTDTAEAPLVAAAVDVLQADATRCGGYTGFLAIDGWCDAARKPLSAHCAPMLHLHVAAAATRLRHVEWFHDHVRIERMLFDGFVEPVGSALTPDRSRPGHGLSFKRRDAERFARP
jgi:L-alanine-DL-glutamate epimerase-like enolase superfamily enzyme